MPSVDKTTVIASGDQPSFVISASEVTSAYSRTGDVVGAEGDYTIDQMGDVDTTTTAPVADDLLSWNGTNWTPDNFVDSGTFA